MIDLFVRLHSPAASPRRGFPVMSLPLLLPLGSLYSPIPPPRSVPCRAKLLFRKVFLGLMWLSALVVNRLFLPVESVSSGSNSESNFDTPSPKIPFNGKPVLLAICTSLSFPFG